MKDPSRAGWSGNRPDPGEGKELTDVVGESAETFSGLFLIFRRTNDQHRRQGGRVRMGAAVIIGAIVSTGREIDWVC